MQKLHSNLPLTLEQGEALERLYKFLSDPTESFFLLTGRAGTGKTFCIKQLTESAKGRYIFTAPTNKAVKVLRETLKTPSYAPECCTIYSLLGLRLEPSGEVKILTTPEKPYDLSRYTAVFVDEAFMVNAQLFGFIKNAVQDQKLKFIFIGDSAQLPPVGELRSPVASINCAVELQKVMRHEGPILTLATEIRRNIGKVAGQIKLLADEDGKQGVWKLPKHDFVARIKQLADDGAFADPKGAKAIAWRNATVRDLNQIIRSRIFDNAATEAWLPGDRIILTEPAFPLEKDDSKTFSATTDDEGTVERCAVRKVTVDGQQLKVWELTVLSDWGDLLYLRLLHSDSVEAYDSHLNMLAAYARANPREWKGFWQFKESVHKATYAYAITAHRAQGSTYKTVCVHWKDILTNRNREEALRCLYVACTRPTSQLFLGEL